MVPGLGLLCTNSHLDLAYMLLVAKWLKPLGLRCSTGIAAVHHSVFAGLYCARVPSDFTCIAPFLESMLYFCTLAPFNFLRISAVDSLIQSYVAVLFLHGLLLHVTTIIWHRQSDPKC